jgi:hypothetical protein
MRLRTVSALTIAAFLLRPDPARLLAGPPDSVPEARALQRQEKYAEATRLYEAYLAGNRFDGAAWADFGYCLHMVKQYDKAIPAFETAAELGYHPSTQLYNIACGLALTGRKDEAFAYLKKSLEARFADQGTLARDGEIDSLRPDPRFAELTGLNALDGAALSREEKWRWDLAFFIRRMEQMHWDLYARVAREQFRDEVNRLASDAAGLTDDQVRARLMRILALVGDGHTNLAGALDGETTVRRMPLHLFAFADGLHVLGAPPEQRELVGAKVLKVGPLDVAAALDAVKPYCSVDNEIGYLAQGPGMLVNPVVLEAIGAATGEGKVSYTLLSRGGTETTVAFEPVEIPAGGQHGPMRPGYVYAHQLAPEGSPVPLFLRDPVKALRFEVVPEQKLGYFWLERCATSAMFRSGPSASGCSSPSSPRASRAS